MDIIGLKKWEIQKRYVRMTEKFFEYISADLYESEIKLGTQKKVIIDSTWLIYE